jgi:hypothetical protein
MALGAAQRLCDAAALAASSAVFTIPKCGHHLMDDAPLQLRNAVLGFLLQCDAALLVRNKESRRPELLGIRPLPQYATLEQAMQALKPRPVPTAAVRTSRLVDAASPPAPLAEAEGRMSHGSATR